MRLICNHPAAPRKNPWKWRWLPRAAQLFSIVGIACGNGGVLVLGDEVPRRYRFDAPQRLEELSIESRADNPSLTADLLEIYFTTAHGPDRGEVWSATRSDKTATFDTPVLVTEINSPSLETSPIVSEDGLTFWVGSDRSGGLGALDIWVSTRASRGTAWTTPKPLAALNSSGNDIPRPPGQHRLIMPLSSDRDSPGLYAIYFASRPQPSAAFADPRLISELSVADHNIVDGFLTEDGLDLFWDLGPEIGFADLYVSSRRSTDDRFERRVALTELNTSSNERDPWLSQDGKLLFFSSDRAGRYDIYVAGVHRESSTLAP